MDSLLASYASSDEEDDQQQPPQPQLQPPPPPPPPSSRASSLFSSLPKPQSSSFSSSSVFSSLPPPKSSSSKTQFSISTPKPKKHPQQEEDSNPPSKSSALFSSLPAPKSQTTTDFNIPPPNPKRVVQFRPPVPQLSKYDEDDEEDEEEDEEEREKKKRRQLVQDTSVKSFLSRMPVPKNSAASTLGAGSAPSSGSGRRSIIETETSEPAPAGSDANGVISEMGFDSSAGNSQGNWDYGSYAYNHDVAIAGDQSYAGYGGYSACGSSGGHDSYGNYAHYESGWYDASSGAVAPDGSGALAPATSGAVEGLVSVDGKRRKGQVPVEIVEVKQDELIKNRPREDQSKLTGIAFGPSYQPAASGKGKPTKLAKRKHQIGALYFDLRQKEMELAERRSKGLLTKAETQAKYGW